MNEHREDKSMVSILLFVLPILSTRLSHCGVLIIIGIKSSFLIRKNFRVHTQSIAFDVP